MIKNLPVKFPELARLRLGEKDEEGKMRRLETWRATSHDECLLKAFASVYGGEVTPWDGAPSGEGTQFEVVSETDSVDVFIPPNNALSTAYERWGKGGCKRRCDGFRCLEAMEGPDGGHMEEVECECDDKGWTPGEASDVRAGACSVYVRLQVVLPNLPGVGIWLMTSGSINAAMEMPAQYELLTAMNPQSVMVPAELVIEPRTKKKAWEKFERKFLVPVLRPSTSLGRLAALAAGQQAADPRALGAAPTPHDSGETPPVTLPDQPESAPGAPGGQPDSPEAWEAFLKALDPEIKANFMAFRRANKIGTPKSWTDEDLASVREYFED